ncbi:hypothetical protein FACS1894191_0060 [Clostridia bacterium]|nr:hypothetical protein FACS1894191_0060 [Clostridia bacterium]
MSAAGIYYMTVLWERRGIPLLANRGNGIKKLRRAAFAAAVTVAFSMNVNAAPLEDIAAETAVLMDAETGQVLFDKNMDQRMQPASMTKIMTGLLVMENASLDEIVTVSEEAVEFRYGVSNIALQPGEELSVDSAMYAMMLPSANDAANALAEHVSGTQAAFARLMNERAKAIGALGTSFENSHGLPGRQHYTTAYDMALITGEAIKNEAFLEYFGTKRKTIPATNLQAEERPLTNLGYMLLPDSLAYYPDVIGEKVGYTVPAGHTMSTVAVRDGRTLICVVMKSGADGKFYDTEKLLDYGFDAFASVSVPAEKLSGFTAKLLDAEETVGAVYFSAPGNTRMLIPAGKSETDIRYQYHIPEAVEKGSDTQASVTLSVPAPDGDASPDIQMTIPLTASVRYDLVPPPIIEREDEPGRTAPEGDSGARSRTALLLLVPAGILALFLKRQMRIRGSRKRRRARIAGTRGPE